MSVIALMKYRIIMERKRGWRERMGDPMGPDRSTEEGWKDSGDETNWTRSKSAYKRVTPIKGKISKDYSHYHISTTDFLLNSDSTLLFGSRLSILMHEVLRASCQSIGCKSAVVKSCGHLFLIYFSNFVYQESKGKTTSI